MKHKFGSMGRVAIALVLALSLVLVMATPVSAAQVVSAEVTTVDPATINAAAEYTVTIVTGLDVAVTDDGDIRIVFPEGTDVPAAYVNNSISINGTDVDDTVGAIDVLVDDVAREFIIDVPVDVPTGTVTVIFSTEAGIVNPSTAADTYQLSVSTSEEVDSVLSETYSITAPTITGIQPDSGNMGDTMWVEVTGTNFVGDAATDVSDTDIDFGDGIEVLQTRWVSDTSIDCEIRIDTAGGAREVIAIVGGTGVTFTANVTGTPQVDVWEKYTPTGDILPADWDADTLEPRADPMSYDTIEAAETACDATETVIVHADTYEEDIDIDQSISLLSLSGRDVTIIDGDGMMGPGVRITAPDVRLQGFTITNFTCTPYAPPLYPSGAGMGAIWATGDGVVIDANTIYNIRSTVTPEELEAVEQDPSMWPAGIGIDVAASDVEVTGNLVYDVDSIGIRVRSDYEEAAGDTEMTGILVEGNTVHDTANTCFVVAGYVTGLTIKGNEIYNSLSPNPYSLWILVAAGHAPSDVTVEGNTISGGYANVWILGANTITISGNTITGAIPHCDNPLTTEGKNISIEGDSSDITITNNDILGADGYGVYITGNVDVSTITINYNDISGNIDYGVLNEIATDVDARYNYWGEIGGPSADPEAAAIDQSTALGNGDIVSQNALYDPWLTEDYATVIASGKRSYGSDAILLEKGWNTLSVPCGLKGSADTFGQIEALGDFLTDANFVGGYSYDAAASDWVLIGESTTLEPGKGFCFQMDAASRFPVLYFDGFLDLPAYDMYEGWNLIGSAFGIDKTSDDYGVAATTDTDVGEGYMHLLDALDSIQTPGSVVISPSVPGQVLAWASTVATGESETIRMLVGESYWVFMTANGTLAGFEVTPFCFTPGTMP